LSIQNLFTRNTGSSMSVNQIKGPQVEEIDGIVTANDLALAIKANLSVMRSAEEQVEVLEQTVTARVKLRPEFRFLKSVPGIGPILSLTIMLETGDIRRFSTVGQLRFVLPVRAPTITGGSFYQLENTGTGAMVLMGNRSGPSERSSTSSTNCAKTSRPYPRKR
jgi:hypothetical protein